MDNSTRGSRLPALHENSTDQPDDEATLPSEHGLPDMAFGEAAKEGDFGRTTRLQQKRNAKNEDALRLANLTRQLIEDIASPSAVFAEENAAKETHRQERHERLLEEMHTLIGKSGLLPNEHQEHLKDEIGIARQQLLRDGAIDDYALMQTLQEIADLQGMSLGGSSMAGKFSSDILDPPEPVAAEPARDLPTTETLPDALVLSEAAAAKFIGNDIFEKDREDFLQRDFERFCTYDISEVGGCKEKKSSSFAKKLKDSLVQTDCLKKPEQNSSELAP